MHKSTGNAIEANEAFERMGADIVRWQFCAQNPSQNINFGYGPAEEVKRRLLTLWNSAGFLVTYANIAGWEPKWGAEPSSQHALDRWLVARTGAARRPRPRRAYERYWTPALTTAFEAYVEDLSNWYIRRSRRRFWDGESRGARDALVVARPGAAGRRAGDAVPGRPPLARARARRAGLRPPRRLARDARQRTSRCSRRWRRCGGWSSSAARRARSRDSSCASRCGGSSCRAAEAAQAHAGEIAEELSVKQVEFGPVEATELRVKPNLPLLGPEARQGARRRCARSSRPASSRSSTAAAYASTGTSSRPRRCSSSGGARKAGRWPARTG